MNIVRRLYLFMVLLGFIPLLVSCGSSGPANQGSEMKSVNIADYFSMKQGDTWTYGISAPAATRTSSKLSGATSLTMTISGTETINGVEALKFLMDDGSYELYTLDDNGLRLHKLHYVMNGEWEDYVFDPPLTVSPSVVTLGDEYPFESTVTVISSSAKLLKTFEITLGGRVRFGDSLRNDVLGLTDDDLDDNCFDFNLNASLPFKVPPMIGDLSVDDLDTTACPRIGVVDKMGSSMSAPQFDMGILAATIAGIEIIPKPDEVQDLGEITFTPSLLSLDWNFFESDCNTPGTDFDEAKDYFIKYAGNWAIGRGDLPLYLDFDKTQGTGDYSGKVRIDCTKVFTDNDEGSFSVTGEGASNTPLLINYKLAIF